MFKKNNKNVIDKIINEEEIKLYKDERELYKDKYKKILKGDINALKLEKERIKHSIKISELPHASMALSFFITLVVLLVQFSYSYLVDVSNSIIAYIISTCMIVFSIHSINKAIFPVNNEARKYHLCLQVLDELEKELLENGELKNYSSEVLEEVAVTQVEVSSKTSNKIHKEKRNKIIKGFFKKKRLKREKNSQTKLSQVFERLKTLNQEELVGRKYWYNRESKECRDKVKNFKILINYITILITIASVVIPLTLQMFNIANNTVSDMLDKKIKIIEQKEISGNKKAEEMMNDFKLAYDYKDDEVLGENNKDLDKKKEVNSFGDMFMEFFKMLYNNIFIIALGGIMIVFLISMFSLKYNDRASHYETLAEYINDELLKDK